MGLGVKSVVLAEVKKQGDLFCRYMFEYFKKIHSIEYEAWLTLKINYHNVNMMLRKPLDADMDEKKVNARRIMSKDVSVLKRDLMDAEFKLFQDKRILKIIKDAAMEDSIGGPPERNAVSLNAFLGHDE